MDSVELQPHPVNAHVYDIVGGEHLLGACYITPTCNRIKLFRTLTIHQMYSIYLVILDEKQKLAYFARN